VVGDRTAVAEVAGDGAAGGAAAGACVRVRVFGAGLYPADAELDLPIGRHSHELRKQEEVPLKLRT
jgi:hypothetical protein